MKYAYAYKSSDGVRHEASLEAESREAAFAALRSRGIRPIKVVAGDGSKANGEVRGVRQRAAGGLAVLTALVVGIAAFVGGAHRGAANAPSFESDRTRRQVIGDAAIIEKGIRTGWAEVFGSEGDRFFASFAIPGVKAGQRNTTVEEIEAALENRVEPGPDDAIEARQIKAMVEGMKSEARAYLMAGGTVIGYGQRLVERQEAEMAIYLRVRAEVEAAGKAMDRDELEAFCEQRNDELRNLGIRPIVLDDGTQTHSP